MTVQMTVLNQNLQPRYQPDSKSILETSRSEILVMYQQTVDQLDYWLGEQYQGAAARSKLSVNLGYREAELTLEVKGSNAEMRAANLALAERDDTTYQNHRTQLDLAQGREDLAKHQVSVFRERVKYLRAALDMYREV